MKIIGFLFLLLNTNLVYAQNTGLDSIWSVTDKVSIKAPKNAKGVRYYVENTIYQCHSRDDSTNVMFTYNDLFWETDSVNVEVRVLYGGTSVNIRNYLEDTEKDSSLTEREIYFWVEKKINRFYNDLSRKITNDYSLNQGRKMRGLYYYSDAMGVSLEINKVVKKFLFLYYYKKEYELETYMRRHIFIDSVVYCLAVSAKYKGERTRAARRKNRGKHIKKIQPSFDRLVNSLIIKEEENQVLIKKEK